MSEGYHTFQSQGQVKTSHDWNSCGLDSRWKWPGQVMNMHSESAWISKCVLWPGLSNRSRPCDKLPAKCAVHTYCTNRKRVLHASQNVCCTCSIKKKFNCPNDNILTKPQCTIILRFIIDSSFYVSVNVSPETFNNYIEFWQFSDDSTLLESS